VKASRIHEHGDPGVLRYEDAEDPVPGAGEVLIRVAAAGVNPADHKHRSGMFKDFVRYVFPKIIGYDVAGTIAAVGEGVAGFEPGTRVFALLDPNVGGGYAELVATAMENCARLPDGLDFETAAGFPCPGLTGVQLVEEVLRPAPGDRVLITGATGMVGRFALHAAKRAGAHVIAAVRPNYAEDALLLGADEVVPLDGAVWTGAPLDGVIDTVGGPAATALARGVRAGGQVLTAATDPLDATVLPVAPAFVPVHPDGARLERLGRDVAAGLIPVPIAARFPLPEAGEAQRAMERGGVKGKIILTVA
jgi:NADPH:quinone reductase